LKRDSAEKVRQHTFPLITITIKRIVIMTNADCIADIEQPEVLPANKRKLTVSYASRHPDYNPALTLKGQWLEAAGFATGTEGSQNNERLHCADRERARTGTAGVAEGGEAVGEEAEAGKRVYRGEWRAAKAAGELG
jgi:hypothetical protein